MGWEGRISSLQPHRDGGGVQTALNPSRRLHIVEDEVGEPATRTSESYEQKTYKCSPRCKYMSNIPSGRGAGRARGAGNNIDACVLGIGFGCHVNGESIYVPREVLCEKVADGASEYCCGRANTGYTHQRSCQNRQSDYRTYASENTMQSGQVNAVCGSANEKFQPSKNTVYFEELLDRFRREREKYQNTSHSSRM